MSDESSDTIKAQMDETRSSLKEKLETLEDTMVHTVQDTTNAVTATVETVKETVQEVTSAVTETVDTVKESVSDAVDTTTSAVKKTVRSVKESLDVTVHFRNHPWLSMGGSVAAGFLIGKLLHPARRAEEKSEAREQSAAPLFMPAKPEHRPHRKKEKEPSFIAGLAEAFGGPLQQLEHTAVNSVMNLFRDTVTQALPQDWKDPVSNLFNEAAKFLQSRGQRTASAKARHGSNGHGNGRNDPQPQEEKPFESTKRI